MSDCKAFVDFCATSGDAVAAEFLEELCNMEWSRDTKSPRIRISSSHQHNACNYTHSGTVTIDGVEYGFIIDNGDWNGTVVREWGLADDVGSYEPPRPTIYTFVPTDDALKDDKPGLWLVYLHWREQPWFQEKERGYNYDRHFAPGGKTETYYHEWAASKGMKIASSEAAQEIIDRPKRDLIPVEDVAAGLAP